MFIPSPKEMNLTWFTMNTLTLRVISLFLINLLFISQLAAAKPPGTTSIQLIPDVVKNQICRDLSEDKTSCESDHHIQYIRAFKQDNDQVVLFFYLKDNKQRYHRSVSIPVKLNSDGQWISGSAFVGEPRRIIRDVKGGLWMHAQFSSTGHTSRLLYSKQGLDWLEIDLPSLAYTGLPNTNLPNKGKEITQFENIQKLCFHGGTMILTLQSTDSGNQQVLSSWRSSLSKLLSKNKNKPTRQTRLGTKLVWETITNKVAKSQTCKEYKAKKNGWLIQSGETLTLLQHQDKNLTIKIVHNSTLIPVAGQTKPLAIQPFAIQIGAYSNPVFVNQLVSAIQKQGFTTFTKFIDNSSVASPNSKSSKIKKLYVGPYQNRETTVAKLAELKNKMSNNKPIQSAFVLKF